MTVLKVRADLVRGENPNAEESEVVVIVLLVVCSADENGVTPVAKLLQPNEQMVSW